MRIHRYSIASALFATALSGCALVAGPPPSIDVLDVRLTGLGRDEQHLATTLCVTNPGDATLAFRSVSAALDVSGLPLAVGGSDLSGVVPPHASAVVPFTVVTTTQNLGPQLMRILSTGSIDYRVHGTVSLASAFDLTVPFARSGHLDPLTAGLGLVLAATTPIPSRCAAGPANVTPRS